MLENGLLECNCKKTTCPRYGNCETCIEYHLTKEYQPYCKREKKSFLKKLFK